MSNTLLYNTFQDPHLQTYYQNKNVRKHLRKVGIMDRHGEIIPKKQPEINQRFRQERIRTLAQYGITQQTNELEKDQKENIRNKYEGIPIGENIKKSKPENRQIYSTDFVMLNRSKRNIMNAYNNDIYQKQLKILEEYKQASSHSSVKTNHGTRFKSPTGNKSQNHCDITMVYLGPTTNPDYDQSLFHPNGYEVIVMQQHCGGENVILFKNNIKSYEKFTFQSRRHCDYPFALTLYVNGLIVCRISVCCEYKHKTCVPLGGKRASFAILNVQGGQPCQICQVNEHIGSSSLSKQKSSDESSMSIHMSTTTNTISDQLNTHQLLYSTISDQLDYDTTISDQNDKSVQAQEMYKNLVNKMNVNLNWKEKSYLEIQLGNVCKEGLNDYEKALDHYLISLEILCQYVSPLDIKLRNLYINLSHILLLRDNQQNDLAIKYFQRVIDIDYLTKNINENDLINDHNYLGLLYKNQQNYSQSLIHFEKSLQYSLLIHFKSKNLNETFFEKNYSTNETIYDKKALQCLTRTNLSDLYFNLATIYQHLGLQQNALIHKQKALQLAIFDQNKFQFYQNYFQKL